MLSPLPFPGPGHVPPLCPVPSLLPGEGHVLPPLRPGQGLREARLWEERPGQRLREERHGRWMRDARSVRRGLVPCAARLRFLRRRVPSEVEDEKTTVRRKKPTGKS
ncbi:hypothetical protein GUJ93_ZPchr0009g1683 [Zizania palustris]|uniref:Uncharacterized protein n=1 Tax=Zizania palustris TaxID=103762 RepID=A0A8J5UYQ2_ZIZPA|nr:hypothetical protein GUJ93_ZPchr0009g1683 [Zizania palustris]